MVKKYKHELQFLVLLIAIFLIWYLGRFFSLDTRLIQSFLGNVPLFYGALLYIFLYVVITFFIFFSKDILWFVGAILFGVILSTAFICIAEIINAFILFHLGRFLGRGYVEKSLKGKYKDLDEKLGKVNFFWLFIFRAAPLIPYRFLDLGAGLTSISFKRYLCAVILGTPVKMLWIQYILNLVGNSIFGNPAILAEYFLKDKNLFIFSLIYLVLAAAVLLKLKLKKK